MKIYFQNEHTAENGKSEYSLGWNNFEKKTLKVDIAVIWNVQSFKSSTPRFTHGWAVCIKDYKGCLHAFKGHHSICWNLYSWFFFF